MVKIGLDVAASELGLKDCRMHLFVSGAESVIGIGKDQVNPSPHKCEVCTPLYLQEVLQTSFAKQIFV